jgi:hypothetical protein
LLTAHMGVSVTMVQAAHLLGCFCELWLRTKRSHSLSSNKLLIIYSSLQYQMELISQTMLTNSHCSVAPRPLNHRLHPYHRKQLVALHFADINNFTHWGSNGPWKSSHSCPLKTPIAIVVFLFSFIKNQNHPHQRQLVNSSRANEWEFLSSKQITHGDGLTRCIYCYTKVKRGFD